MVTVTKKFTVPIGHRLLNYTGPCANIHGHNVTIEITLSGGVNEQDGMIIDFGIIKREIGQWLDLRFDHAFLVNPNDNVVLGFLKENGFKHFVMPDKFPNPTMENLSIVIYNKTEEVCDTLHSEYNYHVEVHSVKVYESETGWATKQHN